MRQVDKDIRICDDGIRSRVLLLSFAWDQYVRRVAIRKPGAL